MSDIFLSYSKKNMRRAKAVERALESLGWDVFRDGDMVPGIEWREHIESKLHEARCVVVLWSEEARKSRWVQEEAEFGINAGFLVPARIDGVQPGFGFRGTHTEDLSDWDQDPAAESFRNLVKGIERLLGPAPGTSKRKGRKAPGKRKRVRAAAAPKKSAAVRRPPAGRIDLEEAVKRLAAGDDLLEQGSIEEALKAYTSGVTADWQLDNAYGQVGQKLVELELFDEAVALMGHVIGVMPEASEAYVVLGDVYLEQDRHAESIEAYEHALANARFHQPSDLGKTSDNMILGTLHWALGNALRKSGDSERAKREIATAKKLGYDGDKYV